MYSAFYVMLVSYIIALLGAFIILFGSSPLLVTAGMIALGAGMAAGFPVILGYIGKLYTKLSGTAFSLVITIALVGNVLANYIMGHVSQDFGVGILPYFLILFVGIVFVLLYIMKKNFHKQIEES